MQWVSGALGDVNAVSIWCTWCCECSGYVVPTFRVLCAGWVSGIAHGWIGGRGGDRPTN
jgi:hypothetical protein